MAKKSFFEVCIIGGGPTGLISAIMLAQCGLKTALIAPEMQTIDRRSTAFLDSSIKIFQILNIWDKLVESITPISKIRLIDDTKRLIRAPEILFDSSEIKLDAFGYNILNQDLVQKLDQICSNFSIVTRISNKVKMLKSEEQSVKIQLDNDQEISCSLCIGADGRNSIVREFIESEVSQRKFDQSALVLNLKHSVPHQNISTEFHTPNGPFTLVPIGEKQSSLVCVDLPDEIERLKQLDNANLENELETKSKSILGKLTLISEKQVFPISSISVKRFGANRSVLVGDSAHALPPIGAQGLNLGVRDVATLGEIVVRAKSANQDLGSISVLSDYERARKVDIQMRTFAVDLLNQSLLTGFLPTQAIRYFGAQITNKIPIIRKYLMKFGAYDSFTVPNLEKAILTGQ